jgi:hypothetical protein
MYRLMMAGLVLALVVVAGSAVAAENPTGTWKWTVTFGDQSRETTLKLKLDGDNLTGTISGRENSENPIEEAQFKGDEVSFKVTRERNGRKYTSKYQGKVSGDTITGTTSFEREGQTQSRPWTAKRS